MRTSGLEGWKTTAEIASFGGSKSSYSADMVRFGVKLEVDKKRNDVEMHTSYITYILFFLKGYIKFVKVKSGEWAGEYFTQKPLNNYLFCTGIWNSSLSMTIPSSSSLPLVMGMGGAG